MFGVLIAEDDPMLGDLVEDALTANGYWVCGVAHTVVNAVALGRLHYPDLAVIDAVDHCWVLLLAVSSLRPVAAFAAPGFCLTANYLARHCVVRLSGEFSRRGRDVTLSVLRWLQKKFWLAAGGRRDVQCLCRIVVVMTHQRKPNQPVAAIEL